MALVRHLAALRPGAMTSPTASVKASLRALSSPLPLSMHVRSIVGILSPERIDVIHYIRIEFGIIPAPINPDWSF
jgi:hypothetical protein